MPEDMSQEIYKQYQTAQDKYAYFLLAAAASGIALVVNSTNKSILSWSMIPLGLSVISWLLSFFFGCKYLRRLSSHMRTNAALWDVHLGKIPEIGNSPIRVMDADRGLREIMEEHSHYAVKYATIQFRLLIIGAIFFIVWHVWEMILRTVMAK